MTYLWVRGFLIPCAARVLLFANLPCEVTSYVGSILIRWLC